MCHVRCGVHDARPLQAVHLRQFLECMVCCQLCLHADTEGSVRATRVLQVAQQRLEYLSSQLPEEQVNICLAST
jgi:hypothetical protein